MKEQKKLAQNFSNQKEQLDLNVKQILSQKKEQQGITLIALVVTIIILLILAGVTINIALGDNGLFSKSKEAVEIHKEEAAREKVGMAVGEYMLDINAREMTEEEQNNRLKEILEEVGETRVASDEKYYETEVDGYIYWVDKETLDVISQGPAKEIEVTGITVSNENKSITIKEGERKTVNISIEPSNAGMRSLNFNTSNGNVAEVANGVITGKGAGTATITITAKSDANKKVEIQVTVEEAEAEKEIESIALSQTTLTVGVGKTTTQGIQVTYTPNDAVNQGVTWSTSDNTKVTVDNDGKVTGVAATGENETVTITATTANGKTATCRVTVNTELPSAGATVPTEGWSIEVAKGLVQRDGLRAHIGEKVAYSPKAGGTWRIFYYNTTAEWGDVAGTIYLKRDYDENLKKQLSTVVQTSPSATTIQKMKDMNPMWDGNGNSSSIDNKNEQAVAYLCDITQWEDYYKNTSGQTIANYAIGSPSVEMYMKAYNTWIAGTNNITTSTEAAKTLMCKVDNTTGYKVGAFGSYTYNGSSEYYTGNNTLQTGPNNLFMTSDSNNWWLASPSGNDSNYVFYVYDFYANMYSSSYFTTYRVCPVVSINL